MQRHLFLYGKELIFCKQQNMENSATNDTSSSASWSFNHSNNQVYLFKHSLQVYYIKLMESAWRTILNLPVYEIECKCPICFASDERGWHN